MLILLLLLLPNLRQRERGTDTTRSQTAPQLACYYRCCSNNNNNNGFHIDCSPRFSGSPPFTRMQNAFNHFICYCAFFGISNSVSILLPNSKIFYLLCTYDPHAGTGLSPIGLSESDTSGCCCWSLHFHLESVCCLCVCVVFCLFV